MSVSRGFAKLYFHYQSELYRESKKLYPIFAYFLFKPLFDRQTYSIVTRYVELTIITQLYFEYQNDLYKEMDFKYN